MTTPGGGISYRASTPRGCPGPSTPPTNVRRYGRPSVPRGRRLRERDIATAGEPRQPAVQVRPVSLADLAALHLAGHRVEIVESQLLPVDIQPAYDGHRDLLKLPRARQRALHANADLRS